MANYLVTGGLGFIGSHLVDTLLAHGHQVRIIDNRSTAVLDKPPTELMVEDIRNTDALARALDGVDGCFHLAAIASVVRCNEDWWQSHTVNLGASVALFERTARAGLPVVYASSAAIYGDNPNVPLEEREPANPLSPYGADKAAMEVQARIGATLHGLSTIGLRFFNVYGPRQRADNPYAGVITKFCDRIAKSEPIHIDGDGSQSRDFVYVGDVARALDLSMQRLTSNAASGTAEIYNVCTGLATSIKQLATQLINLAGSKCQITKGPARSGDIPHSIGAPALAQSALGFTAQTRLDQGLPSLMREPAQ